MVNTTPAAAVAIKNRIVFSWGDLDDRLPLVRRIMDDLVQTWEVILGARARLESVEMQSPGRERDDATADLTEELNRNIERINGYIAEVEALGGMVQEFRRGVVNFPVLHDDRVVMACWSVGSERIDAWHELHETYQERKPASAR